MSLLQDWVELLLRWAHVVAGIAWIGSSFYFVALDASLQPAPALPPGVKGEAWQVHGGGFYQMRKYLVAPAALPAHLTWFKWEAYATWILGFLLLVAVYYLNPTLYLIDPAVLALPPAGAVGLGIASLGLGWLVYDRLCRSPLGAHAGNLALVGFALMVFAAFAYTHVFGGRGAFIHVGALVGTIMVANVFLVIQPNQRIVVADMLAGRVPDPALGAQAKQRSLHNNYLTLPVVFVMVSNHYAFTYQTRWGWLVLACVFVTGFLVRHWFNVGHTGQKPDWRLWPAAAVPVVGAVLLTLPASPGVAAHADFAAVRAIVAERCQTCHAARPSFPGMASAPQGVMLDTPERIVARAPQIYAQAVTIRAMPLGNATHITDAERAALGAWFEAGAAP